MEKANIYEKIYEILGNKEAVIFDMDGVIVDTNKIHENAFRETFNEIEKMFDYKKYGGRNTEETLKIFLSDKALIENLKKIKQEKTLQLMDNLVIYPYVEKLLQYLKNAGIKIGLATSASKSRTDITLKKFRIDWMFDAVVTAEDVKEAKPSPDIYLLALKKLNVNNEKAIVIEDSVSGISAAKNANLKVIAVENTELRENLWEADRVIRDIYSLYSIFTSIYSSRNNIKDEKNCEKLTTIIAAAGKGTRLNFAGPKILYPLSGRTALEIMYDKVKEISDKIILVSNKESEQNIRDFIKNRNLQIEVVVDPNPYGTAGSIYAAKDKIQDNKQVMVIWGDQIGLAESTLIRAIKSHFCYNADLTIPSILKVNPYIHFERNNKGKIEKVLRKRYNDKLPEYGENDSGVFIFRGDVLIKSLNEIKKVYERKQSKDEFDFLDIIPFMSIAGHIVINPHCVSEDETIGMNTVEEAKFHENRIWCH